MRITLLSPSAHRVYRKIVRSGKRQPMLGPAYIAAALRAAGHDTHFIDCDAEDLIGEAAARAALASDPAMIGISLTTPLFSETAAIVDALRAAGWSGHLVLGGAHPTALPVETLERLPGVDSVVLGEGEHVATALAEALARGAPLTAIPGLVSRDESGRPRRGPAAIQLVERLDDLPLPALDLYPHERYVSEMWGGARRMGVLITTRGCPYHCTFCASGQKSWGKLRYHAVDRVLEEVRRLKEEFAAEYLIFNDDTFTVKPSRCLEIARRLRAEGLALPFMITARVDTVSDTMLGELAEAGCFMVTYGIESGSDEVLARIGKQTTTEQARQAVAATRRHGIKAVGNYMFGHYADDAASCERTLAFARELECDISQFSIAVPYPGTELHVQCVREGRLLDNDPLYDDFGYYGNVPWRHPNLATEQLLEFQRRAYAPASDES